MASESLLPTVKNQVSKNARSADSLRANEEITYGEQLSSVTELLQGTKPKSLFISERSPLQNEEPGEST